jgi:predicted outer membrane repeat protein
MAIYTVTTLADSGAGSLRAEIALANGHAGADTIAFDSSLSGGTLHLVSALPTITDAVTIEGVANVDGTPGITITGDVNGDDVRGAGGVTDIAATQTAGHLGDNVRIFDATANLTLNHLLLTGGYALGSGGAVYGAANVTIGHSVVSGNGASVEGGGIVAAVSATLSDSTVSGNIALTGGGIAGGIATLTNTTVSGNSAATGGGIASSSATLSNSTVSGNSAGDGGGISSYYATLTNTTVSGNSAAFSGGGIYSVQGGVTLTNSIVLGNSAARGGVDLFGNGSALTYAGGNIVGTGGVEGFSSPSGSATKVASTDLGQVFASIDSTTSGGALADNGGSVETIALMASASDPALDASDDSLGTLATDARGVDRVDVRRAGNDGSDFADLGAYELQSIPDRPPAPQNDAASVTEYHTVAGNVVAGAIGGAGQDSDPDGDTLTVIAVAGAKGTGKRSLALMAR